MSESTNAATAAAATDAQTTTAATITVPSIPSAVGAAATPSAPAAPAQTTEPGKVEDLPDWAQKLIKDTRSEAAGHRTKATAAETKQAETLAAIAKALGLGPADETPDPAKLTEQLTTAQTAQRAALVELAVFKAAGAHKADPAALLDSRTFLASVTDIDPSGSDFATKVDAAIKAAVDGNPKLKAAAQAAGASTIPHAGGSGEAADIDAQIDAARKAGQHELAISLQHRKAYTGV